MLAKISFFYEQEQFSGRKALKLFKELFIADFWWNKTAVVDKLTLLYLRDEYLFSPYNIKTFKSRQVMRVEQFINWEIMSDFRLE